MHYRTTPVYDHSAKAIEVFKLHSTPVMESVWRRQFAGHVTQHLRSAKQWSKRRVQSARASITRTSPFGVKDGEQHAASGGTAAAPTAVKVPRRRSMFPERLAPRLLNASPLRDDGAGPQLSSSSSPPPPLQPLDAPPVVGNVPVDAVAVADVAAGGDDDALAAQTPVLSSSSSWSSREKRRVAWAFLQSLCCYQAPWCTSRGSAEGGSGGCCCPLACWCGARAPAA